MPSEEFDWKVFEKRLEAAKSDQVLHSMLHTWGDWEKYYQQYPISPAGWNFIDLLRNPVFSRFQNKIFCLFPNSTTVNIGTLATWSVRRANETNSNNTTQELIRYLQLDSHNLNIVSVIPALRIEQDIHLSHDLLLTSKIPSHLNFEHLKNLIRETGNASFPYSFLIERKTVSSHHQTNEDEFNAAQKIENYKWYVLSILGLFTERESPAFLGVWTLLENGTPFSGWLDAQRTYYPELKLPEMMEEINSNRIDDIHNTLNAFLNIPKKIRTPIEVGLYRLGQAMNTMNSVQKAIDLGIALESLFIPIKNQAKISHHFAVIGSSLLTNSPEQRVELYNFFKYKIYKYRSDAVHSGQLVPRTNTTSINSELSIGIKRAQECFKAAISIGGVSKENFKKIIGAWQ